MRASGWRSSAFCSSGATTAAAAAAVAAVRATRVRRGRRGRVPRVVASRHRLCRLWHRFRRWLRGVIRSGGGVRATACAAPASRALAVAATCRVNRRLLRRGWSSPQWISAAPCRVACIDVSGRRRTAYTSATAPAAAAAASTTARRRCCSSCRPAGWCMRQRRGSSGLLAQGWWCGRFAWTSMVWLVAALVHGRARGVQRRDEPSLRVL